MGEKIENACIYGKNQTKKKIWMKNKKNVDHTMVTL